MKKIFLDCGSNYGQGYESIHSRYNYLFETYMFEPNSKCFEKLKQKYSNINLINKAVWNSDCSRKLNIEYCNVENDFVGGSTNILLDDFVRPIYLDDSRIKETPDSNSNYTECLDLSNFILKNFNKEDFIVMKLDVEGSEFEVLNKMILDNSLSYINELYIEWHYHMRKTTQNSIYYYIQQFNLNNIKYYEWH